MRDRIVAITAEAIWVVETWVVETFRRLKGFALFIMGSENDGFFTSELS